MAELSIVVPVYGCALSLRPLHERIMAAVEGLVESWELVLVNDGSTDGGWAIVAELADGDSRVIGVDLSRNFGQHSAINAGLAYSSGEYVVVMDCDLQDRPEEIPRLWSAAHDGFDVVVARRKERKDPVLKRLFSGLFHRMMSFLTGYSYDAAVANFGCYHRRVIDSVMAMGDVSRSFPLFVRWVGFPSTAVDVQHAEREFGKTTYSFRKALKLALGAMMTFSDRPLRMVVSLGLGLSVVATIVALGYFVGAVRGAFEVEGWATVVISIWLIAGIVIMIQGVVGLYVAKIFDQTKQRPLYLVREVISNRNGAG